MHRINDWLGGCRAVIERQLQRTENCYGFGIHTLILKLQGQLNSLKTAINLH
jgi:hypothetical protein